METALSPLPPAFPSNILSLPFYPWSHMECVLNSNFGVSLGQTGFFGGFEELSLLVMSTLFQTFRASMERKLDFLIFSSPRELWVCFCGDGESSWSLTLKVRPWTGLTCCLSGSVVGSLLSRREYLFLPISVQMQRYVDERKPGPWRALFRVPVALERTRKKIFVSGYNDQPFLPPHRDTSFWTGRMAVSRCFVFSSLNWIYSTYMPTSITEWCLCCYKVSFLLRSLN